MHKAQGQVRQFHLHVVGGPVSPALPALREAELRARLIAEEAAETVTALVGRRRGVEILEEFLKKAEKRPEEPDLVEAVDGVCDLLYVSYGTAEAFGIDVEPYFDRVHASNMEKSNASLDVHGKKGGKPPGWVPPTERIARLLAVDALTAAERASAQPDVRGALDAAGRLWVDAWTRLNAGGAGEVAPYLGDLVDRLSAKMNCWTAASTWGGGAASTPADLRETRVLLREVSACLAASGSTPESPLSARVCAAEPAARALGDDCFEAAVSVVAVFDDAGRVLLARGPTWSLPGGKRELGETAADAALREHREETDRELRRCEVHHVGVAAAHDGRLMAVYAASKPAWFDSVWSAREGDCEFVPVAEAAGRCREDWREAFLRVLEVVRRAARVECRRYAEVFRTTVSSRAYHDRHAALQLAAAALDRRGTRG